jgi:hypothetical protein
MIVSIILIIIGLILFCDQLYMFGIPFGNYLPDMTQYDATQDYTDFFHHWMLGVVLIIIGIILLKRRYK